MSEQYSNLDITQIRETITSLQSSISDLPTLLRLLATPLDTIGLLPPAFRRYRTQGSSIKSKEYVQIIKSLSTIQTALLVNIVPTWESALRDQQLELLLYQYFCPDSFFSATQAAGDVALSAYAALLSLPFHKFSIDALRLLSRHYTIDRLHSAVYSNSSSIPSHRKTNVWEDLVRNVVSVPAKVANHCGISGVPQELEYLQFYNDLSTRLEILFSSFSRPLESDVSASRQYFQYPDQAFFLTTLPTIRTRFAMLSRDLQAVYSNIWVDLLASLPSDLFSKVLTSLLIHLAELPDDFDGSTEARGLVKREGRLISRIFGNLEGEEDEKWMAVSAVLIIRSWSIAKARMLVCWAVISDENAIPPRALETLVSQVVEIWSSTEHIKHSLLSHHQYLTTLLLLSIAAIPPAAPTLQSLALSSKFISAISTYITHLDPAVRRCGMLAAEIVAQRTGKALDFQQWDGSGQGREWARGVRKLISDRDMDVEELQADVVRLEVYDAGDFNETKVSTAKSDGDVTVSSKNAKKASILEVVEDVSDSDDSLAGYASSSASSRAPSPTPSEIDEIEKDPTINVGRKKIQRPVYLVDLARLITGSTKPDDSQNADRIEMALNSAEELIRRKKSFGFELEENSVNLVYALVGLQNNFELEGFNEKRQDAVTVLVACCPKKASLAIIDEFFKNQYSTEQRFVMLNALAVGARELASLPVPPSNVPANRISFPSKQLPEAMHKKYISYNETGDSSQIQRMLDDISSAAIESGRNNAEAKTPLVRTRQLRISKPARVVVPTTSATPPTPGAPYVPRASTFAELAAEYFIGPLTGKFWLFLRDEQTREARTAHHARAYRGTGTGLILNPLVLTHFLGTLAVLIHAARHSPAFLAVLAPDALELALTLGTRPLSDADEDKEREAAVLTASLELAVVVLDGCLELDGGRSICLESTSLLLGTSEWAGQVLNALESGSRIQGGGGVQEVKLRRSAAGVVLKADELSSRWRQSMISV
ncbi:hypothetical protein EW145_g3819 [Phellinidium pouzarii]|uniref:Telomere length regulation protein conserved domain-containing protein n=1 Tax=Phellinidium pouzarii TaxID=167371 RepID=A0A4S4L612_9AGAM|nr:hypothetical protein EW145_g3819 [Phellinidium pouzarii]